MELLENGDVVTLVSFSVCHFGDVGTYRPFIKVTTGVDVEKAGKKTYHLDGNRYTQCDYNKVLDVGHSGLSRRIVVPHGSCKDAAVELAKDAIRKSIERSKDALATKLADAYEALEKLDDDFKVTEREYD